MGWWTKRWLLGAGLAVGVLVAGCADQQPGPLVESAKEYLARKDYRAASIQLKNALQLDGRLPEARFLLGQTLLHQGEPAVAAVELQKAGDLGYPADAVVPLRAKALLAAGEYAQMLTQYATTTLGTPAANAELKTWLAAAHAATRKTADADRAIAAALQAAPQHVPALVVKAGLLATRNERKEAIALLDEALKLAPDDIDALVLQGELLAAEPARRTAAAELFNKALTLRKDSVPAHVGLITIHATADDHGAAKRQLEAFKAAVPNHPLTRLFEAQLAMQQGEDKAAADLLQPLLKAAPDDPRVQRLAGVLATRRGSLLQAELHFSKALQAVPHNDAVRRSLVETYLRTGQPDKALTAGLPLLQNKAADPNAIALVATAYMQKGDPKRAEELYAKALALDGSHTGRRAAVAWARLSQGDEKKAFAELEAMTADDKSGEVDVGLVNAYIARKQYDAALKAIDRLERKQPGKPWPAEMRGRVLLLKRDQAGARRAFEKAHQLDPAYFPAIDALSALDLQQRKPEAAEQRLQALLKLQPEHTMALLGLARVAALTGKPAADAEALIVRAVKGAPQDARPRLLLVQHHLAQRNPKQALIVAQEAAVALPDNPTVLEALGRAQLAAGDNQQAISTFNKLATTLPNSPAGPLGLAEVQVVERNYAAAEESLKRAQAIAPNDVATRQKIAAVAMMQSKPEAALTAARQLQAQQPDKAAGWVLEGDVEVARKQWAPAAAAYQAALQKDGSSTPIAERLHRVLGLAGKRAEADALGARWLKERPDDVRFMMYLGTWSIAQREYAQAQQQFAKVVEKQPDNAAALNNLAWAMLQTPKAAGAREHIERALKLRPNEPAFLDTLALALAKEGNTAQALVHQRKAVELQPDNSQLRLQLARLQLQAGDKAGARAELDRLSQLGSKFAGQAEVEELKRQL